MNPLVSIIIPFYQQAKYLRTAIGSVLTKDYELLEVLVFDGAGNDGSLEILESYGDRIWFRSAPDGGQCDAINEGFRKSRGEFVAWLNSDDFYYPGTIAHAVEMLRQHSNAALVYGEGNLVAEDGSLMWRFPETVPFDLWKIINHSDYILQPTVFFRRDKLFKCGLLDESLNWGLDWELWVRIGKRYPCCYTDQVLAEGRIYGDTKTATGGFRRMREIAGILHRHGARRLSPALISHSIITLVRRFCNNAELITPEVMTESVPGGIRKYLAPVIERIERRLRKWLQNVQGVWPDSLVGKRGTLWLPSDGRRCWFEIDGRNLAVDGQEVALTAVGQRVSSGSLKPWEGFALRLLIPEGQLPVKLELRRARNTPCVPLDPRFGERRAGCRLLATRLVET